jgi:AraC-like DNA-binding protein
MYEFSVGLNMLQAARFEHTPGHICDWSKNPRPFSTVALLQHGSGSFEMPGAAFEVGSGQAFFIPASSKYISHWRGEGKVIYYAIHFNFDNRYSEFAPQKFCPQLVDAIDVNALLLKIGIIQDSVSKSGFGRFKAYSAFYALYADLLPLLRTTGICTVATDSVKRAIEFIEQNSEDSFTVKSLADMCGLSESRFFTLFHQALGCAPIAYRNSVRIRKAAVLLGEDFSIDEVAAMSGFASTVLFRRVFKEIMGRLPSEFKKNLRF